MNDKRIAQQRKCPNNFLFAAKRSYNKDGTTYLTLVYTKTGERFEENEEILDRHDVHLGDFLYMNPGSYCKAPRVGGFDVDFIKNVAYVKTVPSKLEGSCGPMVFKNDYFGRSRCNISIFEAAAGNYTVDISLLDEPIKLPDGSKIFFDSSNPIRVFPNTPSPVPALPPLTRRYLPNVDDEVALLNSEFATRMDLNLNLPYYPGTIFPRSSTAVPMQMNNRPLLPPKPETPLVQHPVSPFQTYREKFLFAARRCFMPDGTPYLVLIEPRKCTTFTVEEAVLKSQNISLGGWLRASVYSHDPKCLHSFKSVKHKQNLNVKTEGSVAYVAKVRCTLINKEEGHQEMKSYVFANALAPKGKKLPPGTYFVQISLLAEHYELPDGSKLYFEATNVRQMNKNIQKAALESPVIYGAGFSSNDPETVKMRAVVMSEVEQYGVPIYFLWILDRQTEGRLVNKDCKLKKGHFFEGLFRENSHGKWDCEKYEKGLDTLVEGGLDSERVIWFKVKIDKYKAASGNMKFSEAQAKYFGKIVDTEEKLSEGCNGKQVKIQRKAMGVDDFVWAVIEVM